MTPSPSFWAGKSVAVTGHTGFKGSWLALWLHGLGARIHGISLPPPTNPSLYEVARVSELLTSDSRVDLTDLKATHAALEKARPEIVFHLAAQSLVRESYRDPIGTLATNFMGTAHLLECIRSVGTIRCAVIATTDKVYENREWAYAYREVDRLGGRDPYSASKAAAELLATCYRESYLSVGETPVSLATARAGNVIGGGDWAQDRLVPDCLKAFANGEAVRLRFPNAVRPWQHVLEPLSGYLLLAERLMEPDGPRFASAWNFGPEVSDCARVGDVALGISRLWGQGARVELDGHLANPHEAGLLRLDNTRAQLDLKWRPRWSLQEALLSTVRWHQAWLDGQDMRARSREDIEIFQKAVPD